MGTVVLGVEVRELGVGVKTGKEPLQSCIVELAMSVAKAESCVQASWHNLEGKVIDPVLTAPHTTYRSEAFSGTPQCHSEFSLPSVRDNWNKR